ncbi:MAG: restriction endonuclease [Treponema sp.]|nr:MAG: restriction endonuclease [Treponema sp.]
MEVLCEVQASKWTDTELFRFYRSTGAIGELYVRDLHSKIRDIKCDKAFCVTAGSFTEEAKKYAEGRPIDLIEKTKLIQVLNKLDVVTRSF